MTRWGFSNRIRGAIVRIPDDWGAYAVTSRNAGATTTVRIEITGPVTR